MYGAAMEALVFHLRGASHPAENRAFEITWARAAMEGCQSADTIGLASCLRYLGQDQRGWPIQADVQISSD